MRESLRDIAYIVEPKNYHSRLPEELVPYHAWLRDYGHSIMCVLSQHLDEARKNKMSTYELPIPVKYVLENGYTVHEDCIEIEARYDQTYGVLIDRKYEEW
ncbi:MAG TPA: hypothetical protein VEY51_18425 [Chondromyces sp.]|nr:hypothetical protein [Chondromyces sp.]